MPVHLLIFCSCIAHVENVAQDFVVVEAKAEGAEGQEELYQELEVADGAEEQTVEPNFTNSESQPGKHQKHITQYFYTSLVYAIFNILYLCIEVYRSCLILRCMW